ncbi:MAG: GspE/PulE family protein [Phycisphaerales bacterium]
MGKFDIDDILNNLAGDEPEESGSGGEPGKSEKPASRKRKDYSGEERRRHTIDKAEKSFTTLPSVPSGQRSFSENIRVENDPSVPVKPLSADAGALPITIVHVPKRGAMALLHADPVEALTSASAVTAPQLGAAQQVLKSSPGRRLVDVLLEQGGDEASIQAVVAGLARLDFERIDFEKGLEGGVDGKLLQRLTVEHCKECQVVPIRVEGEASLGARRLVVGMVSPNDPFAVDELKRRLGMPMIKVVVVTPGDVKLAMDLIGQSEAAESAEDLSALLADVDESDVEVEKVQSQDEVDLEKAGAESPVIRYVNFIIQNAVKEGASDIHIEPCEKKVKIRFRIDGNLFESMSRPASMAAAITSRLKIMANLDISERRVPQDGRIRCTVQGRKLDLRVSTLPNSYGEKTVMRILDTRSINVQLEDLGFDENTLTIWKRAIDEPHGIVLVTGPTGSGKTTTLYASLKQLDKTTMNVSTVEDPIEYHLDGITQTQTHEKIGMTFAKALKALLRQDPDVIMLGEIRDHETAHTAVQAALTGHLVLSTLHTNDAPSSITRLINIGLEPFLIGAAIRAVLAQRLLRRLCVHCRKQEAPSDERGEFLSMLGMDASTVWVHAGCEKCRNRGYTGRVGIYELLSIDDQLRDIIARNPNVAEFKRVCIERGMQTLRQDGLAKAAKGMTSVEEVLRATESGH